MTDNHEAGAARTEESKAVTLGWRFRVEAGESAFHLVFTIGDGRGFYKHENGNKTRPAYSRLENKPASVVIFVFAFT